MKNLKKYLPTVALMSLALFAQAQDPSADAAAVVTTASTVFTAVAALTLGMVGFYLILRVVKGIRK